MLGKYNRSLKKSQKFQPRLGLHDLFLSIIPEKPRTSPYETFSTSFFN